MGHLKNEFNVRMFGLGHDKITNFYLSCFQKGHSVLPLLFIRIFIFLTCLATLVISLVKPSESETQIRYWPIYMTNWGVVLINVTSAFAVIVSGTAFFKVPFGELFDLNGRKFSPTLKYLFIVLMDKEISNYNASLFLVVICLFMYSTG